MLDGGTNCGKGGTTMAAVHGPGGPLVAPCLVRPATCGADNLRCDRSPSRVEHFMQSTKRVCQAMGLCLVSLVSIVTPHDTVDPNFEIMTHSLRYKKNGET